MKARPWLVIVLALVSLISCAPRAHAEEIPFTSDSLSSMRSGTTAFLHSFGGTAIPIAMGVFASTRNQDSGGAGGFLVVSGYLFGPSMGHFYAGRSGRAFKGVGIRIASLVGVAAAAALSWNKTPSDSGGEAGLAIACAGLGAIDAVVDIASASHSARVHNEEVRQSRLRLAPARIGMAPGIQVQTTF